MRDDISNLRLRLGEVSNKIGGIPNPNLNTQSIESRIYELEQVVAELHDRLDRLEF